MDLFDVLLKHSTILDIPPKNWNATHAFRNACEDNELSMAKVLIKYADKLGIDINAENANGWTPFMLACKSGNSKVIVMTVVEFHNEKSDIQ